MQLEPDRILVAFKAPYLSISFKQLICIAKNFEK
jgi:hypothetical protein